MLPPEQAEEFISIWEEFEAGQTNEAKFAKAMDRFEPLLQNASNKGGTWTEYNVVYERVFDTAYKIKKGSETIWSYTEDLLDKSVEEGILVKR
jgi:putative hydrolases of HD superfamily